MPASRYRAGFLAREANVYDAAKLCTRGLLVYVGPPWRAGFGREVGENISATKHEYLVGFTHTSMVCRTVKYKSHQQQFLNSHSANCIYT
jgi:hypothetical protein